MLIILRVPRLRMHRHTNGFHRGRFLPVINRERTECFEKNRPTRNAYAMKNSERRRFRFIFYYVAIHNIKRSQCEQHLDARHTSLSSSGRFTQHHVYAPPLPDTLAGLMTRRVTAVVQASDAR